MNTPLQVDERVAMYDSFWDEAGSSAEFMATTTVARQAGAQGRFRFEGTGVEVYATIGSNATSDPEMTFIVDGNTDTEKTTKYISTRETQYGQVLYRSPSLFNRTHDLLITFTAGDAVLWLDYFMVEGVPLPVVALTAVTVTTIATNNPTATVLTVATGTITEVGPSSTQSENVGWILAGIFGGILALGLFIVLMWYLKKYNRSRDQVSVVAATGTRAKYHVPNYVNKVVDLPMNYTQDPSSGASAYIQRIEQWRGGRSHQPAPPSSNHPESTAESIQVHDHDNYHKRSRSVSQVV